MNYIIATSYKFVELPKVEISAIQNSIKQLCDDYSILGTILLAEEGINFTISSNQQNIEQFLIELNKIQYFADLHYNNLTQASFCPFKKMKIRLKKEIVSLKEKNLNLVNHKPGYYLNSEEWDTLISREDVVIIDTRNDFEFAYGTFKKAINPETKSFSEIQQWIAENLSKLEKNHKIAMFCTGGIRCEKSTAYLKSLGFEEVYHLQGGIIQYLVDKKNTTSLWEGNLFIFDDRIALDKNLQPINQG